MPHLEVMSRSEAELRTASAKRAEVLREYIGFIEKLQPDQAGKLEAGEGETTRTVRRRLGDAARLIGKALVIKRDGEVTYYWLKAPAERRGGPRKIS
jgi:hypothetical protein